MHGLAGPQLEIRTMKTLSQAELAVKGIILLRGALQRGAYPAEQAEALAALCDYTESAIDARARGGRKTRPETARANGRKHLAKRRE